MKILWVESTTKLISLREMLPSESNMLGKAKEDIVNEQKSPLFRIMAIYSDDISTQKINPAHIYFSPELSRHTFLLEAELVEAFYSNDIALYRIVNRDPEILNKLPYVEIDYEMYTESDNDFFCLQSAPHD